MTSGLASPLCKDLITDAAVRACIAKMLLFFHSMIQLPTRILPHSLFKSKDKWQLSEDMKVVTVFAAT